MAAQPTFYAPLRLGRAQLWAWAPTTGPRDRVYAQHTQRALVGARLALLFLLSAYLAPTTHLWLHALPRWGALLRHRAAWGHRGQRLPRTGFGGAEHRYFRTTRVEADVFFEDATHYTFDFKLRRTLLGHVTWSYVRLLRVGRTLVVLAYGLDLRARATPPAFIT